MSLKEAAEREAALKALLDEIDKAYTDTRKEVQKLLDAAKKENGTTSISVELPDGPKVASVNLKSGTTEAKVTDEDAFLEWVRDTCPSEIKRVYVGVVTSVQPAFRKKVLAQMTAANRAEWVDGDGVIHEVPGVEMRPGRARTHEVRFTETGRADIAAAWRGELTHLVLPELTPGGEA